VSGDGQHGIGLGVPGCPDQIGFKKDETISEAEAATGGEGSGKSLVPTQCKWAC